MKPNDVYRFHYHPDTESRYDRNWCFDGLLTVKEAGGGGLLLVDSYWGSGDNRTFTPEKAAKEGKLALICNLDDVEPIKDYEAHRYAPEDIFNLSYQHGCYKRLVKRKGAPLSKESMLKHLREKLAQAKRELDSAAWSIELAARDIQRVEDATDLSKIFV